MTSTNDAPRVLLVGAYERDNFGDLLFLLVTEQYLPNARVYAAAPFSSDMTALLDRQVQAYGPLLESERFDAIWTVGGQVGGTDLRSAYRMSAPPEAYRQFKGASEQRKAELLREAAGPTPIVAPYIPSAINYPLNAGAIGVLNSVGLSGIRGVRPERRDELIALVRGQDFITVRDQPSSDYLSELGIDHQMVPDAVHAINVLRPGGNTAGGVPDSDVAILQASTSILGNLGHEKVAASLVNSKHLDGLRIRLLMAGVATSHDSVEDCAKVVDHVQRMAPQTDIEVLDARRPFDLVDQLAQAKVVIGTSLHVRIIAGAYGVPRVTLKRAKPTMYAKTWDSQMPFDVGLDGLDQAVADAFIAAERPEVAARAAELSQRAHDNLTELSKRVLTLARTQSGEEVLERRESRRRQQLEVLTNRVAARDKQVRELTTELTERDEQLGQVKTQLGRILGSRTYQAAARCARAKRAVAGKVRGGRSAVSRYRRRTVARSARDGE